MELRRATPGSPAEKAARSRAGRTFLRATRRFARYYEPHQVFTHQGRPPRSVYADRHDVQGALRTALLQANRHVLVSGPAGVGKTALVHYIVESEGLRMTWVYPDLTTNGDAVPVFLRNLIATGGAELFERQDRTDAGVEARPGAFGGKLGKSRSTTSRWDVKGPVSRALEAIQRSKTDVVFIDDLERFIDAGPQSAIYDLVTQLLLNASSGYVARPITVVVAGPGWALDPLVDNDRVATRVKLIRLSCMRTGELQDLLERAQDQLGLRITSDAMQLVVDSAAGMPAVAHLIGETASTLARHSHLREVTREMVLRATKEELTTSPMFLRARRAYERALEFGGGDPTYRRIVLQALADAADLDVPLSALKQEYHRLQAVLAAHDEVPIAAPLAELVESKTIEVEAGGTIRLRQPILRAYVRLVAHYYADTGAGDLEVETRYEGL